MIRLARISLREIRLLLREPFKTSAGVVDQRRIVLLQLIDTDGTEAWSECVAQECPDYSPDTVDTCWLALYEWIIPAVLARPFDSPRAAHALLEPRIRGHRMARAAVEMGIWAIAASRNNSSLAALLSNESANARDLNATPRPFVETGVALGMQSTPDELVARALAARDEGYRRIKIKITPGRDAKYVRAARAPKRCSPLAARASSTSSSDASEDFSSRSQSTIAALTREFRSGAVGCSSQESAGPTTLLWLRSRTSPCRAISHRARATGSVTSLRSRGRWTARDALRSLSAKQALVSTSTLRSSTISRCAARPSAPS